MRPLEHAAFVSHPKPGRRSPHARGPVARAFARLAAARHPRSSRVHFTNRATCVLKRLFDSVSWAVRPRAGVVRHSFAEYAPTAAAIVERYSHIP